MKRISGAMVGIVALAALPTLATAGKLEDSLEARWRGAWVLTVTDIYSDCAGTYTTNNANADLVRSRGHIRFHKGELAQVKAFDLEHSGMELSLTLSEPMLVSYQDGPFTLYKEARCQASLNVEVPRDVIKSKDPGQVEAALQPLLIRFTTDEAAMNSRAWNHREREPYPEDYDLTLAKHAAWKAEQTNTAIQARIDEASVETARITERVNGNTDYLRGFSAGIEAVRSMGLDSCEDFLDHSMGNVVPKPPQLPAALLGPAAAQYQQGFQDGGRLVFGLEAMRHLSGCMVEVPQVPEEPAPAPAPPMPRAPRR